MRADRDDAALSLGARMGWLAHALKAATQQHHLELREAFRPHVPDDAVVFDVGAHAGQFSKLFAAMAPRGRVYAFEPSGYARSVLKPALRWNRVRNVEIVPFGLSDADGASVLHTPIKRRGQLGFGLAHLGEHSAPRATNEQTIRLTTMDGFVAERGLNRLDFIKADVEGWELNVLKGGVGALSVFHPVLFLEVVGSSLARAGAAPGDIWAQLEPLGYRAAKAPDFHPVDRFEGDGDYLFTAPHTP
jgi:FkbM family methyltransferase